MQSYTRARAPLFIIALMGAIFSMSLPTVSLAKSTGPSCSLSVLTTSATVRIRDSGTVLIKKGETVQITWKSTDATKAFGPNGRSVSLNGKATSTPNTSTTYTYRFTGGNNRVKCSVTVRVVSGDISATSLKTTSSKPLLSGKATKVDAVRVQLFTQGSTTLVYESADTKVRNGKWKIKILKSLADGRYDVKLLASSTAGQQSIATGTLAVGDVSHIVQTVQTQILGVESVPLLLGGTAHTGASVAVLYLHVVNIGKVPATITGFRVVQNGSASTDAVSTLTVVDDAGGSRGSVGGPGEKLPFKNSVAIVPTNTTILPGQMKLFTVKATLANNMSLYQGTQLKIDLAGVISTASIRGRLPIRGTTWTIAQ